MCAMHENSAGPYRNRLLIVQPYIPSYRVPFFTAIKESLAEQGIDVAIAAAQSSGSTAARNDDLTTAFADFLLPEKMWSMGSRSMIFRSLGQTMASFQPRLVVVEQAIKNLEALPLLFRPDAARRPSVAMWGQGRTYSTKQNALAGKLKQLLTRRADWFFAYTRLGAEYVVAQGFPPDRTTVLWNSIDTTALQADLDAVSTEELASFRSAHGLTKGNTALFLGGIDERKGMNFLLESAREIGVAAPDFRLLVGGSGEMAGVIAREAASGGPVRHLGRLEGKEKALALAAADFLMIPEWVGLVAVDSLAAGRPLVSTRHGSHSPEFEYLVEGETLVLSEHEPSEYARAVLDLMMSPERLARMSDRGQIFAQDLSIERMADNFVMGVHAWQSWLKSHNV